MLGSDGEGGTEMSSSSVSGRGFSPQPEPFLSLKPFIHRTHPTKNAHVEPKSGGVLVPGEWRRTVFGEPDKAQRKQGKGLHSSTFRLNVRTFCGILCVCGGLSMTRFGSG